MDVLYANSAITTTHRRALCAVQMDFSKSYEELLVVSDSDSIHMKNLCLLMMEVYKCIHRLNPEFMWNVFKNKDFSFSPRLGKLLTLPAKKISGTNDLVFRACLAWNNLPSALNRHILSKSLNLASTKLVVFTVNASYA